MAKKKVTSKKSRQASTRKSSTARKTGKTTQKKKKTSSRGATRKTGKTTKKKTARTKKKSAPARKKTSRKTTKKKAASTGKKAPARSSSDGTKKKKKTASVASGTKGRKPAPKGGGRTRPEPAGPAPDADGYVIINGRRVRMMTRGAVAPPAKRADSARPAEEAPEQSGERSRPAKTRLNKKDLQRFRNLLIIKRAEIVGDLSAMEAQALQASGGNLSHMPIHMADIGTDTYDQDFMLGLAETERRELRAIDEALQRIEDGTYGICQLTGKPIPKARLNAKPWAKYTIEAARMIERGYA